MSNTQHTRPNPASAAATSQGIPVQFNDVTYWVPDSSDWPIDALEAGEEGRSVTCTRLILGDVQWTEFRKTNKTVGDLERFMEEFQKVVGGNL